MTSKLIKTSKFVFYVLLVGTIFLGVLPQPKVNAAADTVTLSKQRTILHNFIGCVTRYGAREDDGKIFDTHRNHFKQWDDAIADDMDDQEWVVGLDVDTNGVLACLDIVPLGINTLIDRGVSIPNSNGKFPITNSGKDDDKQQKTEITFWFAKYVTGYNLGSSSGNIVNTLDYKTGDFEKKLRDLADLARKEIDKIGEPTDLMNQRRYIGLFNLCYNSASTKQYGEIKTGDGDFERDGKYFYKVSNDDVSKILTSNSGGIWRWYKTDNTGIGTGDTQHLKIDDLVIAEIQTGGLIAITQLGRLLDDESIHAYYPVGSDIQPSKGDAARREGMTKCDRLTDSKIMNAVFAAGTVIDSKNQLAFDPNNANSNDLLITSPSTEGGKAVNGAEVEPSCETSGFSLSWITCGIINGMAGLTQGVFNNFIEPYLKTAPVNTDADVANPVFKVWSSMRSIANIIIIFALLAVVFSQSIGGGMIDAYTAKKIMPRLLAAAIFVNISIYLVAIMIDIFNILGNGIGNLILGPFKGTVFNKFENTGNDNSIGAIIAVIITAVLGIITISAWTALKSTASLSEAKSGALMPFMHFILIFVLLPAVLITLAIFATLIIRQGIILLLIVTAPIAFALFALPSTEKYFKKWWSLLISTLMVYPIITVIFSCSIILAALSYNNPTNGATFAGIIGAIVAFIILIVPLALIPFSFKLAGGVIANLSGSIKGKTDTFAGTRKQHYKEVKGYMDKADPQRTRTGRMFNSKHKYQNSKLGGTNEPDKDPERAKSTWGAYRKQRAISRANRTTRVDTKSGGGSGSTSGTSPTDPTAQPDSGAPVRYYTPPGGGNDGTSPEGATTGSGSTGRPSSGAASSIPHFIPPAPPTNPIPVPGSGPSNATPTGGSVPTPPTNPIPVPGSVIPAGPRATNNTGSPAPASSQAFPPPSGPRSTTVTYDPTQAVDLIHGEIDLRNQPPQDPTNPT